MQDSLAKLNRQAVSTKEQKYCGLMNSTLSLRFLDSRSFVISCTRGDEDLIIFLCGFVHAKRMLCGIRV